MEIRKYFEIKYNKNNMLKCGIQLSLYLEENYTLNKYFKERSSENKLPMYSTEEMRKRSQKLKYIRSKTKSKS